MSNQLNSPDANGPTGGVCADATVVMAMMRDVSQTLRHLDGEHDAELDKLEGSRMEAELKRHVRSRLVAKHRERREPYVALLTELHRQHRRPALVA
jgi:hypothetical protein